MGNTDEVSRSSLDQWKDFLRKVYNNLIKLVFKLQNISFDSGLTKVQKYRLKKNNPNLPEILISKSPGEVVDMFKREYSYLQPWMTFGF